MVKQAVERFGRLDILVNNAGMNNRKPPEAYSLAEWHEVVDTNLTSAFLCAQAAYPEMKRAGGGKIINIGSMTSIFGVPFAAPYARQPRAASSSSRKCAGDAWAKDNIQVNAVLPGWIDTDLTQAARKQVDGLHERVVAPHAGRTLGHARRFRRHRRVPRRARVGLRHRDRDPGRWRLFGAGLERPRVSRRSAPDAGSG